MLLFCAKMLMKVELKLNNYIKAKSAEYELMK